MKCGINLHQVTDAGIGDFLYRLPEFEEALSRQPNFSNTALLKKVDALLADDAREASRFRDHRKELGVPAQEV
jgi:hypothetical protein